MGCVRSPAAAAMTSNRRRGIDLPLRLLAVVAIARGAGVSKAENVFTRSRVERCGAALEASMRPDWSGDADALRARLGGALAIDDVDLRRADGDVFYAVGLLRTSAPRAAWVGELVARHPKFAILNATDKHDPDAALAHYEALGLRLAFKMNPGQAGLWLTELRFLFCLLLSGKPYGVLLEDDAAPVDGFEAKLEAALAAMPPRNRYSAYRLGAYTTGMVSPGAVIRGRFNVSGPRAIVPEKASTRRACSERRSPVHT